MSEKKEYKFFVDGKQFTWPESSITGAKIKEVASVPAGYQLFLEEQGSTPDKPIADGEAVDIAEGKEKHFFAVPPATFGH